MKIWHPIQLDVALAFSVIFIFTSCNHSTDPVLFWPSNAIRNSSSEYVVNSTNQLEALRRANPNEDAEAAFKSGDFRFIADRPNLPRIQGIPYDHLVERARTNHGLKVISFSDTLLGNKEFLSLKATYEEQFNRRLYKLMDK